MKTLKFMLAAATAIGIASVAQAAQNVKASTGFEKLPLGQSLKEPINVLDNDNQISYFWYAGENPDDNESEIVAFTGDLPVKGRPTGVKNFTGADIGESRQALQVSTGTDPLLRTFNGTSAQGPVVYNTPLGEVTYVDTLVQFTVTPSTDTVTPGKDDKLMIYLKETASTATGDDGVAVVTTATNLVVQAGYLAFDAAGAPSVTPKEYKANLGVVPGKWYRLTVAAIPGIATAEGKGEGFIGFRVSLDGEVLTFDSMTYLDTDDGAAFDYLDENSEYQTPVDQMQILLSLQALNSQASNKKSLHAVGFAGEGLVDDLVVTTTDPSAEVVNFMLTAGENVTAVSYTIGTQSYTLNSGMQYDVAKGSTIEITSVEYAEGYEYDSYTSTGLTLVSFDGITGSFTVTANEAATLTINAKATASAGYPDYIPAEDATVKGLYDAWKANVAGAGDVNAAQNQFLLNTAASNEAAAGDATLKITSIAQNANGGWDIVVGCTVEGVKLTGSVDSYQVCNGYLAIEYASELGAAAWTKENIAVSAVDAEAGTVTVNVNKPEAKFLKAELSLTKAPTVE